MTTFTPYVTATQAADELRELLANDSTVYVLQRHVSKSGMLRRLSLFTVRGGELVNITVRAAAVLGEKVRDQDHTVAVNGAGMDMHFHTVYRLSRALYTATAAKHEEAGYVLRHRTI